MEKTHDRVLAYKLANVISKEELTSIAGGLSGMHSTTGPCGGGTMGNDGYEIHIDIQWDF